ncbi:Antilisterial bacteriocin subtilosin biosynthesis protein AlbA [Streptomyces sp. YIM 121038]|uniref:radical SAM protein n=1 Tax=Streptomyces sp. YIM 121038 TaxID=2136401 RepID=UPI001163A726|nr:radical SAM protein [Streptomyces sp. YIM 121038]QCX74247.1 Antilisterial bacteriocin subtilosin biosynthesis protein AlbA [Streptomyces sp. YIM 121038]
MSRCSGPEVIVWDTTYACPLRCSHCYSESGRRPSRQLGPEAMLRVADALASLGPRVVALSGGEPLVVRGVFEVAQRLRAAGVKLSINTSGWVMNRALAERLADHFDEVIVSLDGATSEVHDRIRGREGSFERVLAALTLLDEVAAERSTADRGRLCFGVDCVVIRSNFGQLEDIAGDIAHRFPRLTTLGFNAAVPEGLASRPEFGVHELLDDDQVARLTSTAFRSRLRELAPSSVAVFTTDNLNLVMKPERVAEGTDTKVMQVEPDGLVRGIPVYEGTVGSLLEEPAAVLWERTLARLRDPFVVETLSAVESMGTWAQAVRRMDRRFGSADDIARIDQRSVRTRPPEFVTATVARP